MGIWLALEHRLCIVGGVAKDTVAGAMQCYLSFIFTC